MDLFFGVQTQWRFASGGGMGGGSTVPTGLDYTAVRASPAFRRLPRATRESTFDEVCVMERAWVAEAGRLAREAMDAEL